MTAGLLLVSVLLWAWIGVASRPGRRLVAAVKKRTRSAARWTAKDDLDFHSFAASVGPDDASPPV